MRLCQLSDVTQWLLLCGSVHGVGMNKFLGTHSTSSSTQTNGTEGDNCQIQMLFWICIAQFTISNLKQSKCSNVQMIELFGCL